MTLNKNAILYRTLARALSIKRPSKSDAERALAAWLAQHVPDKLRSKVTFDAAGNLHIDARLAPENRTLFTAHMDTVHRAMGPNKIRKTSTHWHASGDVLGADDGAGCAMLMHLMHSGTPAYYLFTVSEECGGIGAKFAAKDVAFLKQFDRAIAFDRRGIDSVITHQGWGRTASDAFAQALSDALNEDMTLMYLPDDTGVYTDTAEFVDVIPECTNISVGYDHEHSERESLDILHFAALAKRVVSIDWDALPTDRDPTKHESKFDSMRDWTGWSYSKHKPTSVNSSFDTYATFSRGHYFVDDYDDILREDLRDAIYDAMAGNKQWLVEMLCESVYPEDPEMAQHFIDRGRLDDAVLDQALKDSAAFEPDVVMCYMFDQVYKEK